MRGTITSAVAGVNSSGCCTGDTKIGNSTTTVLITYEIGRGECW